jgi:hypothetical protein
LIPEKEDEFAAPYSSHCGLHTKVNGALMHGLNYNTTTEYALRLIE